MADSDSRGSEKPEGSESRLEGLDALFDRITQKIAQDRKQDLSEFAQKVEQGFSEIRQELKQEIGAVAVRMDLMREGFQAAVGEARQFTVEHGEKLRQDLSQELVEVRQQCEGRTEVVESKVEEVREEVTRLRRSLEEQSLGAWGRPECPESVGQGHPYAFSEPGDVNRGGSKTQSMYMWSAPAPEDGALTPPPSPPLASPSQPSVAVSPRHAGVASVPRKPAEFCGQVAW